MHVHDNGTRRTTTYNGVHVDRTSFCGTSYRLHRRLTGMNTNMAYFAAFCCLCCIYFYFLFSIFSDVVVWTWSGAVRFAVIGTDE